MAPLYALLRLLIEVLILRGRPTADRDLELLVLRQELLVLQRTATRPRWRTADQMILVALGRKLSAGALLLVQRATVLGWHRALVHRCWAAFGRLPGSRSTEGASGVLGAGADAGQGETTLGLSAHPRLAMARVHVHDGALKRQREPP